MSHIETALAKVGCHVDPETKAVVQPLHMATTYERGPSGDYPGGYIYSRHGNPTRNMFEATLASLEGGATCAAFASGMAASMVVLQALGAGAHVALADDLYYGVRHLATTLFADWGLSCTLFDASDPANLDAALQANTALVWIETPSNPMLKVADIEALATCTHAAGARLVVDGSWTTPLLQRPLDLGADLVVHSVTKYLAGHSDVLGGAVVCREEDALFERIRAIQQGGGPVMDPFSAWLAMRGMRSLAPRLRQQCATARMLALFLDHHPLVTKVHYPGLAAHTNHDVATRQMADYGGMLSFEVWGGAEDALGVANRLQVFTQATSLGGTESLIEHRASVETPPHSTPDTLLRCSIGLEHPDDLLEDLIQALGQA